MFSNILSRKNINGTGLVILIVLGLYVISVNNYLLFHSLVEIFSVIVAITAFFITWNSRRFINNNYLLIIGVAYLFIGILDLLHTLSYKGMSVFPDYDFYANQVWIATRLLESLTLLFAFYALEKQTIKRLYIVFVLYALVTLVIIATIFWIKVFPICFIEGVGQTPFKIYSEYFVVFLLIASIFFAFKNRARFHPKVFTLLISSLILTIGSELAFTFYISNYGISNLIGHFFKLFSFYLIYEAIISTGITQPYATIFRELKQSEEHLAQSDATKTKLFSIISHDLRNPFHVIINGLNILVKRYDAIDDQRKLQVLEDLEKTAKNTYQMLDNLLLWSRSQTGKLNPSFLTLSLNEVYKRSETVLKKQAEDKEVLLQNRIDAEHFINADMSMTSAIVVNLVTNAIKFTHPNGLVDVSSRLKNNFVELIIEDTGVGISAELVEQLMQDKIVTSSRGTKSEKGTGIGLQLVKEFAELNNGYIEFDMEREEGTKIIIGFERSDKHTGV